MAGDLLVQRSRLAAGLQEDLAGVGGDGEPRRDGETQVGHLGEVRTLPAEKVLQVLVSFGEGVNKLLLRRHGSFSSHTVGLTPENIPISKAF
ncbi:hypothetical protein Kpho01_11210 [Kitasatospora phosalacinea]|uniref:Uncharacterized protein n=1 Tax=Kitasatospora phosalacinea TaxID=2065 RepID=A0A9W6PDJ0_9ACTN|nr:hypothetical protein Kpho01_11210 [Kitasatospora phosalacinea]